MSDVGERGGRRSPQQGNDLLERIRVVRIAGSPMHLVDEEQAQRVISSSAGAAGRRPLAVASINLDHVHHFPVFPAETSEEGPEWFNLIDGAPIAAQARRLTGLAHPRLAGSDLIEGILMRAASAGLSVGVIGGSDEATSAMQRRLRTDWPALRFAGRWSPTRSELADDATQTRVAHAIRAASVDILLVCLGKPRQEEWIQRYGAASGARVLLAFGAVVDFLGGRIRRAPAWVSRAGLEWAWRLAREPRRLARRYLVQGPPAYLAVRRSRTEGRS